MADTLPSQISEAALMESEACSNRAALQLWRRALGDTKAPCGTESDDSEIGLIQRFAGRRDMPARLLAGLLLEADLRPDDRLWVLGARPVWLAQAVTVTAGLAATVEEASVLVTECLPLTLAPAVRRIILTGDRAGQGEAPPGVMVSLSRDWD